MAPCRAHVFATYEGCKRDQRRMDMEDVSAVPAALLAEDDRIAAQAAAVRVGSTPTD